MPTYIHPSSECRRTHTHCRRLHTDIHTSVSAYRHTHCRRLHTDIHIHIALICMPTYTYAPPSSAYRHTHCRRLHTDIHTALICIQAYTLPLSAYRHTHCPHLHTGIHTAHCIPTYTLPSSASGRQSRMLNTRQRVVKRVFVPSFQRFLFNIRHPALGNVFIAPVLEITVSHPLLGVGEYIAHVLEITVSHPVLGVARGRYHHDSLRDNCSTQHRALEKRLTIVLEMTVCPSASSPAEAITPVVQSTLQSPPSWF